MSAWSIAVWALLPAFAVPALVALRREVATRLVAVQLATALCTALLILMSFAFDQPSYVSLALTLAVLNVTGTLVMAMFVERWLVTAVVGVLLALLVAVAWLGAAGFARLHTPLDRLHCATFVNAGGGLALLLAALVAEGLSNRAGNILLVVAVNLLGGAATSHAIGRALHVRGSVPEAD